jgi:hypothetical protein
VLEGRTYLTDFNHLAGMYPGGVTAVRRGNRCFVASPAVPARTFGRTLGGAVCDPHTLSHLPQSSPWCFDVGYASR